MPLYNNFSFARFRTRLITGPGSIKLTNLGVTYQQITPTPSITPTHTVTPTITPTVTPTVTPTITVTPSITPTKADRCGRVNPNFSEVDINNCNPSTYNYILTTFPSIPGVLCYGCEPKPPLPDPYVITFNYDLGCIFPLRNCQWPYYHLVTTTITNPYNTTAYVRIIGSVDDDAWISCASYNRWVRSLGTTPPGPGANGSCTAGGFDVTFSVLPNEVVYISGYDIRGSCSSLSFTAYFYDAPITTLTPTPTITPTPSLTPTITVTPTNTKTPTPTPTITPTSTDTSSNNILFDKESFRGIISEPYLSALSAAAIRWENYIKINPDVVQSIRYFIDPSFNGISLNNYTISNLGGSSYIASCGPYNYADLQPVGAGVQFCSLNFNLNINSYYAPGASPANFSQQDWEAVLTHELGHALGIGVYWGSDFQSGGAHPPQNYFLSGAYYPGIQNAYNKLVGLSRTKIPLEDTGGGGTSSAHWENSYRSSSYPNGGGVAYPGLSNELMVGYYSTGTNYVMSTISISALRDFGYSEKNPGTSEGTPNIINSLMPGLDIDTSAGNIIKYNCPCHSLDEANRVAIINTKTKEVLLSPIIDQ